MTNEEEDERDFSEAEGHDLGKLLAERDRYEDLGRRHRFSTMVAVSVERKQGVFKVRLRRPPGNPLLSISKPDQFIQRVVEQLIDLESEEPRAFVCLDIKDVFVQEVSAEIVLHGPLFGWHRAGARSVRAALEDWRTLLARTPAERPQEHLRGVGSYRDLRQALVSMGLLHRTEGPLDLVDRIKWLRARGLALLPSDPRQARVAFEEAFVLAMEPDLLRLALDACIACRDELAFDEVILHTDRLPNDDCNEDLASYRAWRALRAGDLKRAEQLARLALDRSQGTERALGVLFRVQERLSLTSEALHTARTLLDSHPSEANLACVVGLAERVGDQATAYRVFQDYRGELRDWRSLLKRADIEIKAGEHQKALATLWSMTQMLSDAPPALVDELVAVAERAASRLPPSLRAERILQLLNVLADRCGWTVPLKTRFVFYLLAANLNDRADAESHALPAGPDRDRARAYVEFRQGDMKACVVHAERALSAGICDDHLIEMVAEAHRQLSGRVTGLRPPKREVK